MLPAALINTSNGNIYRSHPRATYGGFVIGSEIGLEDAIEMVELTINYAKQLHATEIIVRNPFRIFHQYLTDETDYAMWYHGFSIKYREVETAVKLESYEIIWQGYNDSTRRNIKKSKNFLTVALSSDFKAYWSILEDNLIKKHSVKPTHTYEEFNTLLSNIGEEKVKLFIALKDGVITAGIVVFIVNPLALHAQYIASVEEFQDLRPLNAVIDEIIRWGYNNNYKYLNLGTSNEDSGKRINAGLFRFKEGFGGRGTLRETMHLII
ncbi:GNAT family N-acetyltransferase [Adhaeribacter pallidiroseus]|uniref:Uncharacterized protein n=1 Tax=Adhaeribacter pallidiroseus TaxID=2072847 RepID=A0A369QHB9_9BACT|nr:GNAT family N-acetyltransferase [Adhaeribacter pallidiroseus]RDC64124.1 hypothetical protein AHMF7616_02734 [Adhaeribacter pallidiroseus]